MRSVHFPGLLHTIRLDLMHTKLETQAAAHLLQEQQISQTPRPPPLPGDHPVCLPYL